MDDLTWQQLQDGDQHQVQDQDQDQDQGQAYGFHHEHLPAWTDDPSEDQSQSAYTTQSQPTSVKYHHSPPTPAHLFPRCPYPRELLMSMGTTPV